MKKKILFIISGAFLVILACTLSSTPPAPEVPNGNAIATSVALTVEASGQIPPNAEIPTPLPTMTQPPPPTEIPATPTITLSPTPSIPMASVSEDTNCRTGPGKVYDRIGALMTNETAEVVGKNTFNNYWIIKNPDSNGNCWLWGYYATIVGNTADLQEYAVPPTPTPSIPVAPSNLAVTKNITISTPPTCSVDLTLVWDDNSENEGGFNVYQDGVQIASYESSPGTSQLSVNLSITAQDSIPFELGVTAFNGTGESAIQTIQVVCP